MKIFQAGQESLYYVDVYVTLKALDEYLDDQVKIVASRGLMPYLLSVILFIFLV